MEVAKRSVSQGELRITDTAAWATALFAGIDGILAYLVMDTDFSADHVASQWIHMFVDTFSNQ